MKSKQLPVNKKIQQTPKQKRRNVSNRFISDNGETETLKITSDGGDSSGGSVFIQPANPDTDVRPSVDSDIYTPPKESPIISEVNITSDGITPIDKIDPPPPPQLKDDPIAIDQTETLTNTTSKTKNIWLLLLLLLVIVAVYFLSKAKK